MVFDERLGYDPDEWEECPETEHIVLVSPFTRYLLTAAAIAFVYYFFKLMGEQKKTSKEVVEENCTKSGELKLQEIPKDAKDLLNEADQYLKDAVQPLISNGKQLAENVMSKIPSLDVDLVDMNKPIDATKEAFECTLHAVENHLNETNTMDLSPRSRDSATNYEQVASEVLPSLGVENLPSNLRLSAEEGINHQQNPPILSLQAEHPVENLHHLHQSQEVVRPPVPQHQQRPPISPSDQQLLNEFAIYDTPTPRTLPRKLTREKRLSEQDERALQDWEAEKALLEAERIKKLLDHEVGGESNTDLSNLVPTSFPSYQSQSAGEAQIQPVPAARETAKPLHTGITNVRDSQLTDYDISDFKETHDGWNDHAPKPIKEEPRRTTGDSDEYVKINEPIYDLPPKDPIRRISPTEAAQLQELCQEYDLGLELAGDVARLDSVPQSPKTVVNVPISRRTDVTIQNVAKQTPDNPRNLATADLLVQDALEYLGNQQSAPPFVMEEDMLNSNEMGNRKPQSVETTSRQVRTNEVFERMETDEHDDMTYAPEIQSVEIPPDQMSESSENMMDYFDKVAAESTKRFNEENQQQEQQHTLRKQQKIPDESASRELKPAGRAPQILPAFSNSSLGSAGRSSSDVYPYRNLRKQSSLLSVLGVTSMQEMLLTINTLDSLSEAMRRAGLETTNLIFGIDYTASNKYQGEESFGGRSLHTIHPHIKNPYQQVITILGRTLAPFAGGQGNIGVYGFGDAKTGDWSTFNLSSQGDCRTLDEVLNVYNNVTPHVALSGPTNFAPLIYQAMETCQKSRDYHILVIIADGQVTNERATRRAIVQACQHPLSIIVVGVGDGPWDMMRVFDESLPKRPWDNFHFVEYHEIIKTSTSMEDGDVKVAVQSLLEIPDQYRCICELGLLDRSIPPRGSEIRRELMHNPL